LRKFAIIGFGCAGYNGAKSLREHAPNVVIDVFDPSRRSPFNPMLSTYHAAGKLPYDAVFPFGSLEEICRALDLNYFSENVLEVTADRTIRTESGLYGDYDGILLATGADAMVPGSLRCSGNRWFTMRTLDDALALRQHLDTNQVRSAAVVGGSMVGIKVAELLHSEGVNVTIVDAASHLFPLAAYESTARFIQRQLENKGLGFRFDAKVTAIDEDGIAFADGSALQADLVCLCIGTRAGTRSFRNSSVQIGHAVVVNSHMETSVPGIYAAGDCCEGINLQTGKTAVIGLWANAAMQGACAGANMAGDHADCPGNILHNITRFFDMDFISLGDITLPGCKHLFDCPEFFVSLVMDGNTLQSVNVVGNYRVSGILKHHLVKQLTGGASTTFTPAQRGLLERNGLPREFIQLIGGSPNDRA
jgi:NAD(P)H-nitrite reductase large subunit